jgi:septal ring factor EnvC (AmiA/AmiB activator)
LLPDLPNVELKRNRRIVYLSALAAFESENLAEASQYLSESIEEIRALTGKSKEVSSLKKKKEVSYSLDKSRKSKQEKQLSQLRRKSVDEAERIMTLKMAAEEMERILARLEEERRQVGPTELGEYAASVFSGLKGQLPSPFRGKVIVPFGNMVDPITNLKSFSPGIAIQGRAGEAVTLVASGKVAYTGNLRGYGNFVIINHDNQYYTTYGGLGEVYVTEGRHLPAGAKLAVAGEDGVVRFELRKGREPLDPVTWIKFESL